MGSWVGIGSRKDINTPVLTNLDDDGNLWRILSAGIGRKILTEHGHSWISGSAL